MIDAYEIGINLALQDGVSAGVEAIIRELEALDAAVAASAAGLERLVAEARAAVATAGTAAVRAPGPGGVKATGAGQPGAGHAGTDAGLLAAEGGAALGRPAAPSGVAQSAGEVRQVDAQAPAETAARTAADVRGVAAAPVAATPLRVLAVPDAAAAEGAGKMREASAPMRSAPVPPVAVAGAARGGEDAPQWAASRVAAVAPVSAPGRSEAAVRRSGGLERVVQPLAVPAVAPLGARVELAMAMGPVTQPAAAGSVAAPATPAPVRPRAAPLAPSARALAAVAGPALPEAPTFGGRPAAPPPPAAEEGGRGGDVVLDGRLVGQWLADRMGRDAARPLAGTTGFDPRQSPAWTPAATL